MDAGIGWFNASKIASRIKVIFHFCALPSWDSMAAAIPKIISRHHKIQNVEKAIYSHVIFLGVRKPFPAAFTRIPVVPPWHIIHSFLRNYWQEEWDYFDWYDTQNLPFWGWRWSQHPQKYRAGWSRHLNKTEVFMEVKNMKKWMQEDAIESK